MCAISAPVAFARAPAFTRARPAPPISFALGAFLRTTKILLLRPNRARVLPSKALLSVCTRTHLFSDKETAVAVANSASLVFTTPRHRTLVRPAHTNCALRASLLTLHNTVSVHTVSCTVVAPLRMPSFASTMSSFLSTTVIELFEQLDLQLFS